MHEPIDTFENRLRKALDYRKIKPIELANKLGLNKGIISQYLKGKYYPKQKRLTEIASILDVSEPYLLGYDVPIGYEDTYQAQFNLLSSPNKKLVKKMIETLLDEQKK